MKYICTITDINDDGDEATIKIENVYITGFVNFGVLKNIGDKALVEILLFDDLEIYKDERNETDIIRKGNSYSYSLFGILDIDKSILKSKIDFNIDKEKLFSYGYLDGKKVRVDVIRIDFYFE